MTAPLTLTSLPLFPLQTVLYPQGQLSLRVFEVRYLDMIRRCQNTGAPFGVVALSQGQEVRQPGAPAERFHDVGTFAVIERIETPQPGLLLMQARGGERFRITHRDHLPHGLWVANVEHVAADRPVGIPPDLRRIALALDQVMGKLRLRAQSAGEPHAGAPTAVQLDDCGWVANRWCELLPVPLPIKQQLMELDNPLLRLELVGDLLDRAGITA